MCIAHIVFDIVLYALINPLLGTFQQVSMGFSIAAAALLLFVMAYGFFATSPIQANRHLAPFKIITAVLTLWLFVSGLLHIIGQVKDNDWFYAICIIGTQAQDPFFNNIGGWWNGNPGFINGQYEYCQNVSVTTTL